jgi:hypothetical protein
MAEVSVIGYDSWLARLTRISLTTVASIPGQMQALPSRQSSST